MASIPRFNVTGRAGKVSDNDIQNNGDYNDSPRSKRSNHESASGLGFGNIPEQMHRKAVKKGFNFTIMVAGESGLGKSTFVSSLLQTELYKDREMDKVADKVEATTKIVRRFIELDEKGVKLRLSILDTPGFGDALNCDDCWVPIEDYIDGAFENYFKEECGLNRKNILDNRVHCCLYFISPHGRGLKPLDVACIRRLQSRVNVVPVIAKADSLTVSELASLKRMVLADIDRHQLEPYRLPECDSDEEESLRQLDTDIKSSLPFSVIGGEAGCTLTSSSSSAGRARKYPWGCAEAATTPPLKHCDFTKLRVFLLKTHMQDLKDMTSDVLYENYRARCITERMNRRQTERQSTPQPGPGGAGDSGGKGPGTHVRKGSGIEPAGTPRLGAARANDSRNEIASEPGFEAIVDPENLLLHKEKEIEQMRQLCEKLQSQLQSTPVPPPPPPQSSGAAATTSS